MIKNKSAGDLGVKIVPVLKNSFLVLGEVINITNDPLDVFGCGEITLGAVIGVLVGHTEDLEILCDIGSTFSGADPVDKFLGKFRMLAVLDDSHTEC